MSDTDLCFVAIPDGAQSEPGGHRGEPHRGPLRFQNHRKKETAEKRKPWQ